MNWRARPVRKSRGGSAKRRLNADVQGNAIRAALFLFFVVNHHESTGRIRPITEMTGRFSQRREPLAFVQTLLPQGVNLPFVGRENMELWMHFPI